MVGPRTATCVVFATVLAGLAAAQDSCRKPMRFGELPGGDSYAFVPDDRPGIPEACHADGSRLVPVRIRPLVPERYPEELVPLVVVKSPDAVPSGIAFDGRRLWVGGRKTGRIYFLDPATGKPAGSMPAPGRFPTGLAWDGGRMWHTDARTRKLYCIRGRKVQREFPLAWHCVGVAATTDGLVIGDWESDRFRLVSPATGKVLREFPAPDPRMFGLTADGDRLWCAYRDCLIVQDRARHLPAACFSVAGRRPEGVGLAGVEVVGETLWLSDFRSRRLVRIAAPRHGRRIAAHGHEREATFSMTVRNAGQEDWKPFELLWNVAIYEMPGQRFRSYDIRPEPVAHYRDADGNLHALFRREKLGKGEAFAVKATARLWSADRWTYLDPNRSRGELPEPLRRMLGPDYPRRRPVRHPLVQQFVKKAVGQETNPYWKLRAVHDALIDRVVYVQPPDESVPGLLRTGKGVCRNFSAALETLGRAAGVPVLDAWAPKHNLTCAYLPGAGWAFVEVTANNGGETTSRRRRSLWFGGVPGKQLTTGVAGPCIHQAVTVAGRPFTNQRHCRLPAGLQGFRETDAWTNQAVEPTGK